MTGTCENCGAMVEITTAFMDGTGFHKKVTIINAVPGQHARDGLPSHIKACGVCGAPRRDAVTMDSRPDPEQRELARG